MNTDEQKLLIATAKAVATVLTEYPLSSKQDKLRHEIVNLLGQPRSKPELGVLELMANASTYTTLDTIGEIHYVKIGFCDRSDAMKFQMAVEELLK
jgi:hypothetical protein